MIRKLSNGSSCANYFSAAVKAPNQISREVVAAISLVRDNSDLSIPSPYSLNRRVGYRGANSEKNACGASKFGRQSWIHRDEGIDLSWNGKGDLIYELACHAKIVRDTRTTELVNLRNRVVQQANAISNDCLKVCRNHECVRPLFLDALSAIRARKNHGSDQCSHGPDRSQPCTPVAGAHAFPAVALEQVAHVLMSGKQHSGDEPRDHDALPNFHRGTNTYEKGILP